MIKIYFLFLTLILFNSNEDFSKGEMLYEQGNYEKARVVFEIFLKSNPNHYKTIEYLGDIAGHQKRWDEATLKYTILKVKFPKSANYWYKYGGALGMKAKSINKFKAIVLIDDVEDAFLTATKLDLKHIDARWALVMFYIELPGIVGGSETKAIKYSNELMELSQVDGYLSKGYIDEYFNRYKKAELSYIKAYEIGNSKTTFQKLYNLYFNKLKDKHKANKLKEQFEKHLSVITRQKDNK